MKIVLKFFLFAFLPLVFIAGTLKEFPHQEAGPALVTLTLEFDNVAGNEDLQLDNANYTNAAGESFSVSQLQYFISNIKLGRVDGTEFVIPQENSYFLVQENNEATRHIAVQVAPGDYNRLSFIIGVDSIRNTVDISKRTGVLDPASSMDNGMYWGWNSGYIFFKMEGNSNAAPVDPAGRKKFRYHIGGFGGYSAPTINNIKSISLDLNPVGIASPGKDKKTTIHVKADILKAFTGKTNISIAAHPSVMFSEYSVHVADNYSQMFSHYRTVN